MYKNGTVVQKLNSGTKHGTVIQNTLFRFCSKLKNTLFRFVPLSLMKKNGNVVQQHTVPFFLVKKQNSSAKTEQWYENTEQWYKNTLFCLCSVVKKNGIVVQRTEEWYKNTEQWYKNTLLRFCSVMVKTEQ